MGWQGKNNPSRTARPENGKWIQGQRDFLGSKIRLSIFACAKEDGTLRQAAETSPSDDH